MKRGTIVLTPFPFTDLSGNRVRPALVISRSDRKDVDLMITFITNDTGKALGPSELLIETTHQDLARTGLKLNSVIRLDKLVTVDSHILLGSLGELSEELIRGAIACLTHALDL